MITCKSCGMVYDEFYNICPKCGTAYKPEQPNKTSVKDAGSDKTVSVKNISYPQSGSEEQKNPEAPVTQTSPLSGSDTQTTNGVSMPLQATIYPNTEYSKSPGQYDDNYEIPPLPPIPNARKEDLKPKKKSSKGKLIAIISIICVILIGAAAAVFIIMQNNRNNVLSDQISIGEKYLSEEKYDDAIDAFKKAIELDPNNPELYTKLADAYIGKGDFENAIKTLEDGYNKTNDKNIKKKLDALKNSSGGITASQGDAIALSNAYKTLYAAVSSGVLNSSSSSSDTNGIDPGKLPKAGAPVSACKSAADSLTINDAVIYGGLTSVINETNIGNFVYTRSGIFHKDETTGIPLTLNTTLGTIRDQKSSESSNETSTEQSSAQESSVQESSRQESSRQESSKQENSRQESSKQESSKQENSKQESSKQESSKQESSKQESSRQGNSDRVDNPLADEIEGVWILRMNSSTVSPDHTNKKLFFHFDKDGSASAYSLTYTDTTTESETLGTGTWTINGNIITVTINGDPADFTYENGIMKSSTLSDLAYLEKDISAA